MRSFVPDDELHRSTDPVTESPEVLAAAYAQLNSYAVDLKASVRAERERRKEVERAYYDTLVRLVRASRYRDQETGHHITRTGEYAQLLVRCLGLSGDQAETIPAAAPLHDLGKIGVPDRILLKEGPLDEEEWELMKQHTTIGAHLLEGSRSPLLERAREIALSHHEKWDGSGYPQGLSDEEIPFSGRLVMIGDCYDALRSERPYKPGFSHEKARRILLEGDARTSPGDFDPQLLEVFETEESEFDRIYESFRS